MMKANCKGREVMTRKIIHRALRISRGLALATGAVVICAVVLGAATVALAAAPGDPFRLGKGNVINQVTKLVGKANSPRLVIDNNGNGVALSLQVRPGRPPMQVNSSRKVARLNADRLDNLDQGAFLRKNGKAADADKLDGKDSTQFVSGYNVVTVSSPYNSSSAKLTSAYCPTGQRVLGGGAYVSVYATEFGQSSLLNVALISNGPVPVGPPTRAWTATADEMVDTNSNWRLIVYAICAETTP
jgi:hypothetical protein